MIKCQNCGLKHQMELDRALNLYTRFVGTIAAQAEDIDTLEDLQEVLESITSAVFTRQRDELEAAADVHDDDFIQAFVNLLAGKRGAGNV